VMKAIQISKDPDFKHDVKSRELLEEAFKLLDLGPAVLFTKEEADQNRKREMQELALVQAQATVQTLLNEAEKRGIPLPQAVLGMLEQQAKPLGIAQ